MSKPTDITEQLAALQRRTLQGVKTTKANKDLSAQARLSTGSHWPAKRPDCREFHPSRAVTATA